MYLVILRDGLVCSLSKLPLMVSGLLGVCVWLVSFLVVSHVRDDDTLQVPEQYAALHHAPCMPNINTTPLHHCMTPLPIESNW